MYWAAHRKEMGLAALTPILVAWERKGTAGEESKKEGKNIMERESFSNNYTVNFSVGES